MKKTSAKKAQEMGAFADYKMPVALDDRLTELLDKQDETGKLTSKERKEAEALVELANFLTLLKFDSLRRDKKSA